MIEWIFHDGQPPAWSLILEAAKEWGTPPWVVEDGSWVWFERWLYQRGMIDKKAGQDGDQHK